MKQPGRVRRSMNRALDCAARGGLPSWWLLGLAVFVAVVLATTVPPFAQAIQRGHQKRAMSELRSIGTAVESYRVDVGVLPPVVGRGMPIAELAPFLEPTFVKQLPRDDPWGRPFLWSCDGEAYSIVSEGKDRAADGRLWTGATTSFASDLYFSDGGFTQYPTATMN